MSKYLLKISGSNEIVNIIEWDGSGSLSAPSGYEFQPYADETIDHINYTETEIFVDTPNISGNLSGNFTGQLTGSILFNGKTFSDLIHESKYGDLIFLSGSVNNDLLQSNTMFLSENNIVLPISNNYKDDVKDNYNSTLNKILEENISNYGITLKLKNNPNIELKYLAHTTQFVSESNGTSSYYEISASLTNTASYYYSNSDIFNSNEFLFKSWYVDFTLPTELQVGTFYGEVKAEGVLSVNQSVAVTSDLACDMIFALNKVVRDGKILEKGASEINGAIIPDEGYTYAFDWDANWFWIVKPNYDWDVEFFIGFQISNTRHTLDVNKDHLAKPERWKIIVDKIQNTKNKESVIIKFDGLRDNTGGKYGNITSRKSASDTYLYVQPTDSPTVSISVNSGNDEIIFLPVKVIPRGISANLSGYNIQNRPTAGEKDETKYQGYTFCATVDFLGTCDDCGTESETTEDITNIGNSTDIDMQWHTNIVYRDSNGSDATYFEEMEVGDIAIADYSRAQSFLGQWDNYPTVTNYDIERLVVKISDNDIDNTTAPSSIIYLGGGAESHNGVSAYNPDMNKLYTHLKSIKNIQDIKPILYGRNYDINGLTTQMTIRCLDNTHTGAMEQFDIESVEFLYGNASDNWANKVSAGGNTSSALKNKSIYKKSLWMWGDNSYNNTGKSNGSKTNTPYRVTKNNWTDVSVGGAHTLALDDDGYLWAWGKNERGQLGLELKTITKPTRVTTSAAASQSANDLKFQRFYIISSGRDHSAAIFRNNAESVEETRTLLMCGDNTYRQIPNPSDGSYAQPGILGQFTTMPSPPRPTYMDISCGSKHTLMLATNKGTSNMSAGWLYGVGSNQFFQLGTGANTGTKYEWTAIADSNGATQREWKYIHAGDRHSFAIKTDGTLWAWGSNLHGQLGFGDTTARNVPTKVGTDTDWKKVVACGVDEYGFSLGLKENGDLYVWGNNQRGQLGLGDTISRNTPTKLNDGGSWSDISGGDYHSIGSKRFGLYNKIYTWGLNADSQLGNGDATYFENKSIPTLIRDITTDYSYVTYAVLDVKYLGGSNSLHMDGILTNKHKLKVSIDHKYDETPAYVEIFTVFDYDQQRNSYKKWKRKGWERTVKVICIGGGGSGGTAAKYEYGHILTSGGGGGGGAVSIGEFLAQPQSIKGYTDNLAIHYGIPKEVDIWVGPGGFPSETPTSDPNQSGGTNGVNGGFSRFGDYVIASGGDGGKAGIKISFEDFLYDYKLGSSIKDIVNKLLLADGGKGGGKLVFTKKTETKKGRHTLYPFTNNNTPNTGLSPIYVPGGNGGTGIIKGECGVSGNVVTNKPITDIEDRITELLTKINPTAEEIQEIQDSLIILDVYNIVLNDDTYNADGESVFYGCTGGGAGWGNGGAIFGTKYAHEFGTSYDNVAALLPQSIKYGDFKEFYRGIGEESKVMLDSSNYNALGYKLGLGGRGNYPSYEAYFYGGEYYRTEYGLRDPIYSTFIGDIFNSSGGGLYSIAVPITHGGFPGGGGGGGIPSTSNITGGVFVTTISERRGGFGGDGVVVVIGY